MLDLNRCRNNSLRVTASKDGPDDGLISKAFRKVEQGEELDDPYQKR